MLRISTNDFSTEFIKTKEGKVQSLLGTNWEQWSSPKAAQDSMAAPTIIKAITTPLHTMVYAQTQNCSSPTRSPLPP